MTRLLVVGAGGHGVVVAEAAAESGNWTSIAFVDDQPAFRASSGRTVIGSIADLCVESKDDTDIVVAIGDNARRVELLDHLSDSWPGIAYVVHPGSVLSGTATVAEGSVVFAGAIVNARAKIDRGVILNTSCTVDHDCHLEEGAHISPGANLAGNVSVGRCAWVGIGAAVREGVRIGESSIVGAGAAVVCDVPDGVTVGGVPARVLAER